ncbi:MAG: hypothetical protein HKN18_11170 [Silicimonas sp.]|nr:hypothetical protein [Silicimonas sp.]
MSLREARQKRDEIHLQIEEDHDPAVEKRLAEIEKATKAQYVTAGGGRLSARGLRS